MNDARTARLTGGFYILATLAGMLGLAASDSILSASDYLTEIAANENAVKLGVLFELIMAVAVVGIAVSVYPVLKKRHESLAVGYFAARLVEGVIFVADAVGVLLLLTLTQEMGRTGAPDAAYFETTGAVLQGIREWSGHVALDVAVFPLSALLLYATFYRARLVPRWLMVWGLIGAALYWLGGVLVMFDAIEPLEGAHVALQAPLGLQELAFALWLIVKGIHEGAA